MITLDSTHPLPSLGTVAPSQSEHESWGETMIRGQAWTGFEATALQEAMRRSVRDFASLLGVETTTVNNWRAGLGAVTPRSSTQSILDTTFTLRTTADDRARFEQIVAEGEAAWRRRNRPQGSRRSRSNQAEPTPHSLPPSGDSSPSGSLPSAESEGGIELLGVLNRLHKLSRSVDDDVVDQMDIGILRVDGYSSAQIAGNAATAYLSLARPTEVERYGRIALAEMSAADSPWGRALVQIDMARSHVQSPDGDFDAAMEMVHQALAASRGTLMTPVRNRGAEFVRDAGARWGESPRLNTIRDMLGAADIGGTGA